MQTAGEIVEHFVKAPQYVIVLKQKFTSFDMEFIELPSIQLILDGIQLFTFML